MNQECIAIVTPWFGEDLKGGAEQLAWQLATRLAARGTTVEVLTTCSKSFLDDWAYNHFESGLTETNGLRIRRFPVDERDQVNFNSLNARLQTTVLKPGVDSGDENDNRCWKQENINSKALLEYIVRYENDYTKFLFLPYLYGPILNGLPLVAKKAWLQPCLHDEAYAYLACVSDIFKLCKGLLFNSVGEQQLAAQLYGPMIFGKANMVGSGVEVDLSIGKSKLDGLGTYVLCLGRRCEEKGTDQLVFEFQQFVRLNPNSELNLVLAGPGDRSYEGDRILDMGVVDDGSKASLLRHSLALVQPSPNESFSRVLFEAWKFSKPVLVDANCLATASAVDACDGGWTIMPEQWCDGLSHLCALPKHVLDDIGARGKLYADEISDWDRVIDRYEVSFRSKSEANNSRSVEGAPSVHQLLPNFAYGDAISNYALQVQVWLLQHGYNSIIFVRREHIEDRVSHLCTPFSDGCLQSSDSLLYHHSIGCELTSEVVNYSGPKCLVYHNITPPEFFREYRPEFAKLLREGREEMWQLARHFDYSVGDSHYNCKELEIFGFKEPRIAPISVDPSGWTDLPPSDLMNHLQDGRTNILFVGRYAPNKCQHEIIEVFANYRNLDPHSRLILVGHGDDSDAYVKKIKETIHIHGLNDCVQLTGKLGFSELSAFYRTASVFLSLSEHEGFGVPLVEAMWYDLPVVAYRSSAIGETLGGAGLLLPDKSDHLQCAHLLHKVVHDESVRKELLKKQRLRRTRNLPENVLPSLMNFVRDLVAT